jgi:hypothetical protein
MVTAEVSGSIIVRNKNILMISNEDGEWNIPSDQAQRGELGSDTAERVAEDITDCSCQTLKYKKKLKTNFERDGEEVKWQPYTVEIEGEPQKGEWIPISKLDSKDLASPLKGITEKLSDRL